ncbi:BlaI/MecI/CopY family transcriptional regulator [Clostridioides sp. ZZV14-6045]|uniref:BlaI/MecI/CopY family transcriptional regulator n=1 Tax=Clostridioides sp. ZZV14-6045 TaxID=2811489 RepID=UPI001D10A992|nr:BlaI/MecI/CopY family transcriptional regulator [Clostridioides sp. ZZV14-6045]
MSLKKLSKSELKLMKFIWDLDVKVRSDEIVNSMKEKYDWPEKTTLKALLKLSNKNFLYVQETSNYIYYTIAVRQEKYFEFVSMKIHHFLRYNSIRSLLLSLCEAELTDEKLNSLEKWVRDWEEE